MSWKRGVPGTREKGGLVGGWRLRWVCLALLIPASCGPHRETRVYRRTPQGPLEIHLHLPSAPTDRLRPAIVFFFGGGWADGSVTQFESVADRLAEQGLVAARADYRTFGRHGTGPAAAVEDAKSAVRWLRSHAGELGIDAQRIAAAGGSAGGHLAAACATVPDLEAASAGPTPSARPDLLVLYNPVLDVVRVLEHAGRYALEEMLEGMDEEAARRISPLHQLGPDAPPTLMLYGSADDLLPQGRAFLARARRLGVEVELLTAEGQPHGFFNQPPWSEAVHAEVLHFLWRQGFVPLETRFESASGPRLERVRSSP